METPSKFGKPIVYLVSCLLIISSLATGYQLGDIQWKSAAFLSGGSSRQAVVAADKTVTSNGRHFILQFNVLPSAEQQHTLAEQNVYLQRYLGSNAYFASTVGDVDMSTVFVESLSFVTSPIQTNCKIHPKLLSDEFPAYSLFPSDAVAAISNSASGMLCDEMDSAIDLVALYVIFHPDVELYAEGSDIIEFHGGQIRSYMESINGAVVWIPLDNLYDVASEDGVQWMEPPLPPLGTNNDSNRSITQTNDVQAAPYNLNGTGINVLVYDGGTAYPGHADFGGRVFVRDNSGVHVHPTHVSGTIGGSGSASGGTYRGMAPNVTIQSYGFEYDGTGQFLYTNPGDLENDYRQAINTYGAEIANNSIGTNLASNGLDCSWEGNYGVTDALIDAIVAGSLGQPMRIIWANGNERGNGRCGTTYLTTPPPACAKNHITVGALNSNNDSMTSFSSWGPTDDGRLKPDVSAPGCQSNGDGAVTSTSDSGGYAGMCGTSMAAPTVTGLSALILQDWKVLHSGKPLPRNSTLKILLAHNAVDLGNVGPDYQFGYGSVRVKNTIDFMRRNSFFEDSIGQGQTKEVFVSVPSGLASLKATMAWDDPPGAINTIPELVNDLDIVAISPSGTTYYPWTLNPASPGTAAVRTQADHANNIEQVVVNNPQAGTWTIRVRGYAIPSGQQVFSLATSPDMQVDDLTINPADNFASSGNVSGPFSPSTKTYTLGNAGVNSLPWTASCAANWITLSSTRGTLVPGSSAILNVSINAAANTLPVGTATAIIDIVNTASGYVQTRSVVLTISPLPPVIRVETPNSFNLVLRQNQQVQINPGLVIHNDGVPSTSLNYDISVNYASNAAQVDAINAALDSMIIRSGILDHPIVFDSNSFAGNIEEGTTTITNPQEVASILKAADLGIPTNSTLNVVVCGALTAPDLSDVQTSLLSTGFFNSVSAINVSSVTPTLAEMQAFDSALVNSAYMYANATALGDVMANYADSGGGVVCGMTEVAGSSGYDMKGRWASGGYRLIPFGPFKTGTASLGLIKDATHPVMAGVTLFRGGTGSYRPSTTTLNAGATCVAEWSDGIPLVVVKETGILKRVDLGFFPVSSRQDSDYWDITTHGARLMGNALVWTAGGGQAWLKIAEPLTGSIPGGQSVTKSVVFDAKDLAFGTYNATIKIQHNTPGVAPVTRDCQIVVTPDDLAVSPDSEFTSVGKVGGPFSPACRQYTLTNSGASVLNWTAAASTPTWLDVTPASGVLSPGQSVFVNVCINSNANTLPGGQFTSTLSFKNVTSGIVQQRNVRLVIDYIASVPFTETFASLTLEKYWKVTGTGAYRTQITSGNGPRTGSYHVTMDSTSGYSRNELTLTVDLDGYKNVILGFWSKGFSDDCHTASSPFIGGANFDGVAISADGNTWHIVKSLCSLPSTYGYFTVDMDAAIAAHQLKYNKQFKIRFNQYDNSAISADGIAFDDIMITGLAAGMTVTPDSGLNASGFQGGPFSPDRKTYTLTNTTATALDWTTSTTQPWISISPSSGSLIGGGVATVEVIINSDANNLPAGTQSGQVTFTDLMHSQNHSRTVSVAVAPANPPVAEDDWVVSCGTYAHISLTAHDEGHPVQPGVLDYVITSLPQHGILIEPTAGVIFQVPYTLINHGHNVDYVPYMVYIGDDFFTFLANDGGAWPRGGDSNPAVILVDVATAPVVPSMPLPGNDAVGIILNTRLAWNGMNLTYNSAPVNTFETPQLQHGFMIQNGMIVEESASQPALTAASPICSPLPPPGMILVDFDDLAAPSLFEQTTHLTNQYQSLGVVFEGPGGANGGAILNEDGGFGVNGYSSPNFLAFCSYARLSDGGIPRGPETLRFSNCVKEVRFLVGSYENASVSVSAFNSYGLLLDTDYLELSEQMTQMSVSGRDITKVVISSTAGVYILDNLMFEPDVLSASLTYDVYFGTSPTPTTKIAGNLTVPQCVIPTALNHETRYYWKVIARNSCGLRESPVWSFMTTGTGQIQIRDTIAPDNDSQLPFGSLPAGSGRTEQLTVINTDNTCDLVISAFDFVGSSAFQLSNLPAGPLPWILPPGQAMTCNVTFNSIYAGSHTGTITIRSNDYNTPVATVQLVGTSLYALRVVPEGTLSFTGPQGGSPYTPASGSYTLTNIGTYTQYWQANASVNWLDMEPKSGVLDPNATVQVDVSINSSAALLAAGTHNAVMRFMVGGVMQTRNVTISIFATYPPVAQNGSKSVCGDTPLSVTLEATDDGYPNPPAALSYIVTLLPAYGEIADPAGGIISAVPYTLINRGNVVTYVSDRGYYGNDSFKFSANDGGVAPGGGSSNEAVISITVNPLSHPQQPDPNDGAVQVPVNTVFNWDSGLMHLMLNVPDGNEVTGNSTDPVSCSQDPNTSYESPCALSRVAIFQDENPWGYTANQDVLTANGISWTIFRSSQIGQVDLSGYDKVIVSSNQSSTFYTAMGNNKNWFEDYVRSGGLLDLHVASNVSQSDMITLPGGFKTTAYTSNTVSIVDQTHPVVNTPYVISDQALDNWSSSTHGYFSTIPAGAREIIEITGSGYPCAMELTLGLGRIFITVQTVEWSGASRNYLTNTILYSVQSQVVFDVYLDTVNPPVTQAASNLNAATYKPANPLSYGTTYYWKVVAKSSCGSTESPVWSFTTAYEVPLTPSNPDPNDGAANVPVNTLISWNNIAPSLGKEILDENANVIGYENTTQTPDLSGFTYDVYFGENNPPTTLLYQDIAATSCDPNLLKGSTTYYWKVIAKNQGYQIPGPVWSFTTEFVLDAPILFAEPNQTPGSCNPISWSPVPASGKYYVECSKDPNFVDIAQNSGWITEPNYTFCNLAVNQSYWYRVMAGTNPVSNTWQQTSQSDFQSDQLNKVNISAIPGDVILDYGSGGMLFGDDFEDGDAQGWINGSGSYTIRGVTNATAAAGTNWSLTMNGGNGHFNGMSHSLNNLTPDEITFYIRTASTAYAAGYFVVGTGTAYEQTAVFFYMSSNGQMGVNPGPSSGYSANTWYKIRFTFNWSRKTIDYYVNDTLISGDIAFRSPSVASLTQLYLYNYQNTQAWWDEIVFRSGSVGYPTAGNIISTPVTILDGGKWDVVNFNSTKPANTNLTVDVLKASNDAVILSNVSSNSDISSITEKSIKLRANLTSSDPNSTPALHDWMFSYVESTGLLSGWSNIEHSQQVSGISGDLNLDNAVEYLDIDQFISYWLSSDCNGSAGDMSDWCHGADINKDGWVNMFDFAEIAKNWLVGTE